MVDDSETAIKRYPTGSRFTGRGALLPSAQGDVDKVGRWTAEVQDRLMRRLRRLSGGRNTSDVRERRPLDYVWNGKRITHYLNHAGQWTSCPATEQNHHTLRASPP